MKLCKSYRSTYEIADLARKIKVVQEMEPIARHGDKPEVVKYGSYKRRYPKSGIK